MEVNFSTLTAMYLGYNAFDETVRECVQIPKYGREQDLHTNAK